MKIYQYLKYLCTNKIYSQMNMFSPCTNKIYSQMNMFPPIISIEGNIGSGKTTFIKYLKNKQIKNIKILYLEEPIHLFEKYKNHNPLELLSESPFVAQYHILNSIINYYSFFEREITAYELVITDRFINSPIIFINTLYECKKLNSFEKDILHEIFEKQNKTIFSTPSKIFYMDCPVNICLERIKTRNRESEKNTSEIYLQILENNYIQYLETCKNNVWSIDSSKSTRLSELESLFLTLIKDVM